MKFRYVNPKSVDAFIGKYAPVNPHLFAMIIDEALDNIIKAILTQKQVLEDS